MADPIHEYTELLRGIHSSGQTQVRALLDVLEVLRHHSVESARRLAEHEAACAARHEELRPHLERMRRVADAREAADLRAEAELVANRTVATATWWKIAKVAGYVVLPIALGLASHYAPDAIADAAEVSP